MATVQQLEKLQHIQRVFYADDSLEAAVAAERIGRAIEKTMQLIRQRAFLRDERRRLRVSAEQVEEKRRAFALMKRADWLHPSLSADPESHVRINVGGLMFEVLESVLTRDPSSLLAQICKSDPPILPNTEGFFYFDRDW